MQSSDRPTSVTLLVLGVLILAAISLIRAIQSVAQWHFLAALQEYLPFYLAASGVIWAGVGFFLAWGLWRGRPWAPRMARWFAVVVAIFYWLDRSIVQTSAGRSSNALFVAGITLILLVLVFWITSRRKSQSFFGVSHGLRSEVTKAP